MVRKRDILADDLMARKDPFFPPVDVDLDSASRRALKVAAAKPSRKKKDVFDEEVELEREIKREHHLSDPVESKREVLVKAANLPEDLTAPRARPNDPGRVPQNTVLAPPLSEDGDIDLNKLFSSEIGNESDVVKELFSQDNVKVKTELTREQISIISRLELQAQLTQNFFLARVIKEFETLMISRDRMSRQEFVQSFRGVGEMNSASTVFNKLGGIFKNDKV